MQTPGRLKHCLLAPESSWESNALTCAAGIPKKRFQVLIELELIMSSQKLIGLAKEARSLVAFCEEGLMLIGKHVAARASFEEGASPPNEGALLSVSQEVRVHQETAKQTRAFAEEVRDPEIRRLLRELADRYDQMALPDCHRRRLPLGSWK